jgi:hypothetical protein
MAFFKLAGVGGVAHVRAASTTIAAARRSAAHGKPPARRPGASAARLAAGAVGDGADVDESNFARF